MKAGDLLLDVLAAMILVGVAIGAAAALSALTPWWLLLAAVLGPILFAGVLGWALMRLGR